MVTHMLWYRVGLADEAPGKSGLAHFFEHLDVQGMPQYTPETLMRGSSAALAETSTPSPPMTTPPITLPWATDRLELVMALEADRMMNLTLSEDTVQVEREVIVENGACEPTIIRKRCSTNRSWRPCS